MVSEAITSLAITAKKRRIKIKVSALKSEPLLIEADLEKIKLAIQNLIDNAIKYSIPGNEVIVDLDRIKEGKNSFIEIKIKDNGIGIGKKEQKRLFSKFFRAENAVRLQTEGSGLGLFIVKNIIKAHQGKIWFESAENKGSTFYIKLPIK